MESILVKGFEYRVVMVEKDSRLIWFDGDSLMVVGGPLALRSVESWYEREAKVYLVARVRFWATEMGFRIRKVSFRRQKTIWGSCNVHGDISLNLQLFQFTEEVIDYVLIHEIAHTREMNHSRAFWAIVEGFCPDYKVCRKMLVQRR